MLFLTRKSKLNMLYCIYCLSKILFFICGLAFTGLAGLKILDSFNEGQGGSSVFMSFNSPLDSLQVSLSFLLLLDFLWAFFFFVTAFIGNKITNIEREIEQEKANSPEGQRKRVKEIIAIQENYGVILSGLEEEKQGLQKNIMSEGGV